MDIPLAVFLIPYLLIVLIAGIFLFFNLFHLARYGVEGAGTWGLMAVYSLIYVVLVGFTSTLLLSGVDWQQSFGVADLVPMNNQSFQLKQNF